MLSSGIVYGTFSRRAEVFYYTLEDNIILYVATQRGDRENNGIIDLYFFGYFFVCCCKLTGIL